MRYQIETESGKKYEIETEGNSKSAFQKYGKYLPAAGAVGFGLAGSGLASIPMAGLGAGLGEAARQMIGRSLGDKSPDTSLEAAKQIGIQGAKGAASEAGGQIIGKLGGLAFRGLPKVGQMFSGTPSRNLAKAERLGFMETYFPKIARGISRKSAGETKGSIEDALMSKYFDPEDIAKLKLNKTGFANQVVEAALARKVAGQELTVPEALGTVKAIDAVYRDTPIGSKVAPELSSLRQYADSIVSKAHPEYKTAKRVSEATILRSQLSKPLRVNKSRPDEYSGLQGAVAPLIGGVAGYGTHSVLPLIATMTGTSPLAFGVAASSLGSIKNAINPLIRKAIQRSLIQGLVQNENPNP